MALRQLRTSYPSPLFAHLRSVFQSAANRKKTFTGATRQSSTVSNEDEEAEAGATAAAAAAAASSSRAASIISPTTDIVSSLKSVFADPFGGSRLLSSSRDREKDVDRERETRESSRSGSISASTGAICKHSHMHARRESRDYELPRIEYTLPQRAEYGSSSRDGASSSSYDPAVAGTSGGSSSSSSVPGTSSSHVYALSATPDHLMSSLALKKPHISKAQMKEFREAFRLFDKDGDGSITKEELGRVMRSLGQFARAEELRTMLEEIDIDGDGNVSFEEFVEIVSNMGGSASSSSPTDQDQEEQELRDAFRVFDKRNRGYITASDLRAVLQCLGEDLSEEEIEDMIKEVDVDGDGRIDFYEFVRALGEPGIEGDDDEDDEDEDDAAAAQSPTSP
ncbi:calmodulin-like [Nasonia vitripennis]|uniref:EF-hand domain-containing protein n=1 Tax=Nasonia vitripennis TaxID=7425 RepID=A0A7M6UCB8_NASVI|nr:calmodulin-like [Nasonia vitripennis]